MRLFFWIFFWISKRKKGAFKGLGPDLLWPFDGKWWFRVDAFPCDEMEDRFDIWRNDTSTSVLDEKHKKNGISIFIVTSDHDMSSLLRKFRGSKDMPQRSRQKHGTYAMAQDSVDKKTNPSVDNLQLPTNGEHFEDGNHQKQVPLLYRIFCLKKATKFEVTNDRLSCFQKAVSICLLLCRQQKIKTCREQRFCVHFTLPQKVWEN